MKYKIAIFDMDGTILDTLEDLKDSLNYVLENNGFKTRTIDEVRKFVGNGIRLLVERGVGEGASKEIVDKVFSEFNAYYKIHCKDKTKPYDGICEVVKKIKEQGIITAVVSNKSDFAVQELMPVYFPDLFDFALGLREGIEKKPAPDSVFEILRRYNMQKEDSVYIGDSEVDVQTAINSGIDCIAVTWGFRSIDILKKQGADNFAFCPEELLNKLL